MDLGSAGLEHVQALIRAWFPIDVVGNAVVDPITAEDSQCKHQLIERADLATKRSRRHLSTIHGHNNATPTQAYTSNDSSDIEDRSGMGVDGLNQSADAEDDGADNECRFPSVSVRDGPDSEACYESTKLLESDR